MVISPMLAVHVTPSCSDRAFMELLTLQAPVPQERSISPTPSDQSGLYRYACLCDRLVLYMSGIVMPVDIHMIWDNIIFYHFDSFR